MQPIAKLRTMRMSRIGRNIEIINIVKYNPYLAKIFWQVSQKSMEFDFQLSTDGLDPFIGCRGFI